MFSYDQFFFFSPHLLALSHFFDQLFCDCQSHSIFSYDQFFFFSPHPLCLIHFFDQLFCACQSHSIFSFDQFFFFSLLTPTSSSEIIPIVYARGKSEMKISFSSTLYIAVNADLPFIAPQLSCHQYYSRIFVILIRGLNSNARFCFVSTPISLNSFF